MTDEKLRILLVDDDASFCADMARLMGNRYEIDVATKEDEALSDFHRSFYDAVLLDIDLGKGKEGFDVLERVRATDPAIPIIMVTRDKSAVSVVAALRKGASDYIDKSPDLDDLERRICRALQEQKLSLLNKALTRELDELRGEMIGNSEKMESLRREIDIAAEGTSPVLIVGETGTGKEIVAREIHKRFSPGKPFLALNCAAVPRDLFEARLFGSEKGAFTGAEKLVQGVFELAGDGVLFLDEMTEVDTPLQAKLLRVIEEREFERLGSSRRMRFKGKLLASTNRDVKESITNGSFRRDLYYRFSTYVINVPPLRERRGDIPILARYFIDRKSKALKKPRMELDQNHLAMLCGYDWPGNVRELENTIESFIVRGILEHRTIDEVATGAEAIGDDIFQMDYHAAKDRVLKGFQRKYVGVILTLCNGNVAEAARRMGLSRFGLQKILEELEK
jgi:DNA-binding NtrC family response regulator